MSSKPRTSSSSSNETSKRKHVTLTIQQKLEIIKRLNKGENRKAISRDFNIASSTIYDIKKKEEHLKEFAARASAAKNTEPRFTLKKPKFEILDSASYAWYCEERSAGRAVTGPMIMEKAKQLHRDMNLERTCSFSSGWLRKFVMRHGIGKMDGKAGERRSVDDNATEDANAAEEDENEAEDECNVPEDDDNVPEEDGTCSSPDVRY